MFDVYPKVITKKKYKNMFENFCKFKRIYVTGPQRSGTTICSTMIAYDLNYRLIDESHYKGENHILKKMSKLNNVVFQCPRQSYCIDEYSNNDSLICFMIRPIEDIIASQNRVNWRSDHVELKKYNTLKGPISQVKYEHWNSIKFKIINFQEINYECLKEHHLWIDKKRRKNFTIKQTKLEKNNILLM